MVRPTPAAGIVIRALWIFIAIVGLSGHMRAREPGRPYQILLLSYTGADSPTVSQFIESFRQSIEQRMQRYAFDFRMKRWGISPTTVPEASTVINLDSSPWKLYKWYVLSGIAVIIVQAGLLAFLLKFMARHRCDEQALRDLSGRLINAQEEERHRIARELHDDINQQLAVLAIELQSLETAVPQLPRSQVRERLHLLWNKTTAASQDLQHISHRLHPSKLELLGLVGALRGLGNEFKQTPGVKVDVQIRTVPTLLSKDVSLALFRVAQEALHNAEKHSKARSMRLELFVDRDDVVLRISDDGVGFNVCSVDDKSLGILSMEERLRQVGGSVVISSHLGMGTHVEARVPLGVNVMQQKAAS